MPETYWKSFTSFVQVDILQRKDVSHTAGIYTSLCKTLKLGYAIKTCELWCLNWNSQKQSYSLPVCSLFSSSISSSLSTKEIESRSESLGLFGTLKCNPQAFYGHMTKYVLPTVEGTDHGRLLYYYTLLEAAGCEPFVTTTIKPESHVKLLKKLRAVATGKPFFFLNHCNADDTTVAELKGFSQGRMKYRQNMLDITFM